ncbi:MAG: ammonium transporter [Micrococcaceae bacterium]|jgi:Amt family ammonium transporter|uniref:Ammonium transporter n=1 Tax=Arthrobacter cheniae TaxID=1258888 RepID=A0A3A5MB66_9MICC|nr:MULTISPECIES: ammonium transporter [Arthrobacter]MCU1633105.1 ammonium transporter [Micrococcaceae bacterium]MEC5199574.1 Amt family ammonium transporter [Arthrobacter sp. PL16]RJT77802.1 ammonium transporter [Arthrobacter cheniae]
MDSGNVAWILASAALVCLMIPALALFYGGMVGSRRILNMMMMCFGGASLVAVLWALFGYSMAFGNSVGGLGLVGNVAEYAGLGQLLAEDPTASIPPILFAAFQLFFACVTTALVAGAAAGRMKFGAWMIFAGVWATLVYFPIAHWVFAFSSEDGSVVGGWIANNLGAIDYAGGLAVHMNAGIAALALSLVLGRSHGWPKVDHAKPHSRPLVLVGAGLLWVGWFGFNAGSALSAGQSASVVFLNTAIAASAGLLAWALVERVRNGAATSMGAASGLISALVAITPACGAVSPMGALAIGAIAGAVCSLAIELKFRLGFDDSLDVVGVHLIGGILGTLLIGFFATEDAPNGVSGLFYGGGFELLGIQALATIAVLVYSFVVTWVIAQAIQRTVGLRIEQEDELRGIDIATHSEFAYLTDEDPVDLGAPRK